MLRYREVSAQKPMAYCPDKIYFGPKSSTSKKGVLSK